MIEDVEQYETSLYRAVEEAYESVITSGEQLNEKRMEIANGIKAELVEELHDLQLFNAQFDVEFKRLNTEDILNTIFFTHGIYEIQFLLSTNKGEPLKPLNKIASGGELSRIMLALKTILHRGHRCEWSSCFEYRFENERYIAGQTSALYYPFTSGRVACGLSSSRE